MDHTLVRAFLLLFAFAGPLLIQADDVPIPKTSAEKLKKELFAEYDRTIRPSEESTPTVVKFDITIIHFDLCEKSSVLTVNGWAKFMWTDQKMAWNPANHGDLKVLHVPYDELWIPDVVLYNSAVGNKIDQHGTTYSLVYNNSSVLWVPPSIYETNCKLDLRLWPFDRQSCKLVVGSWTHHVGQIDLQLSTDWNDQEYMTPNDEWHLVNVDKQRNAKKYECCEEEYADITYTLTLQRRPEMYKTLVMTPAFVIIILSLSVFILPTQAGEKIVLNAITTLVITIVLFAMSQKLPAIASNPPLIVLFFGSSLLMVAIAFFESVLVIKMSRSCGAHPLPPFIKQVLSGWFGSFILNGKNSVQKKANDEEMTGQGQTSKNEGASGEFQREWLMFASAIDRIFFIVYALIYLIKIITFYVTVL
ncbi:neuronal acetylcholine receptor subunit alpha-2-like [Neocloeon triangulifer]|uniref:neuronal acetylcholine receptor subunit alpha-2-like n=1 Tax=Neocloeon triangulifer TaxID=2078957 RepID=UPI00286FA8A4|nr:neuronal acetylcholine receptor subunit alpha-2-like [Neocloeon triangulifer]